MIPYDQIYLKNHKLVKRLPKTYSRSLKVKTKKNGNYNGGLATLFNAKSSLSNTIKVFQKLKGNLCIKRIFKL